MKFNFFSLSTRAPFTDKIFPATHDELMHVRGYFESQRKQGVAATHIITELLDDGWTSGEVDQAIPGAYQGFYRYHIRRIKVDVALLVLLLVCMAMIGVYVQLFAFQYLFAIPFLIIILDVIRLMGAVSSSNVVERRIILFLNRLGVQFPLDDIAQSRQDSTEIVKRNPTKLFLPTKDMEYFKIFGGSGTYQGRQFRVYIAKKFSHTQGRRSENVYRYFIFYEFMMRPVPFYFSVVRENVFEAQSLRLQNKKLRSGEFQDMDFAAREFNEHWRLRGTDKKLAYQVFDPQMMHLITQIQKADLIGLEISDSSVMLSNRFNYPAINRYTTDMKLVYEIAVQVERNYRSIY